MVFAPIKFKVAALNPKSAVPVLLPPWTLHRKAVQVQRFPPSVVNPASLESSVRHLHSLEVAYPVQYRSALALSSNKEMKIFDAVKLLQMLNHSGPYRKTVSLSGACLSQCTDGDDRTVVAEWV